MEKFALIQSQDKSLALPGYSVSIMLKGSLKPGEEQEECYDESEYYYSTEDDD
ncbi:hypothetical protein DSO57_1024393 [Entomophthora muscae]|nr:hypothetical protein DSO57_1024393 [Entomophthora muscae]